MNQELHHYLEYELRYLREAIKELVASDETKTLAQRLQIDQDGIGYTDVERIVHGAALLNARTAAKIDDRNSEIVAALLETMFPHFLRPIPSLSIVQFVLDDSRHSQACVNLKANAHQILTKYHDNDRQGQPQTRLCQYRLCQDATLLPVELKATSLAGAPYPVNSTLSANQAVSALSFTLRHVAPEGDLANVDFRQKKQPISADKTSSSDNSLEISISESHDTSFELYSFIFQNVTAVRYYLEGEKAPFAQLGPEALLPIGLEEDERILEHDARTFFGYTLLSEFFSYPVVFNRFRLKLPDLSNIEQRAIKVCLFFKSQSQSLETVVADGWLKVNCFPVLNVTAQPASISVQYDPGEEEFPLIVPTELTEKAAPDSSLSLREEIYSVNAVYICNRKTQSETEVLPQFKVPHSSSSEVPDRYSIRRNFRLAPDRASTIGSDIYVKTTWQPPFDSEPGALRDWFFRIDVLTMSREVPTAGTTSWYINDPLPGVSVHTVRNPTAPIRPFRAAAELWQIISQVSINHLSLLSVEGISTLLQLYGTQGSTNPGEGSKLFRCVNAVSVTRGIERVTSMGRPAFVRSVTVETVLDGRDLPPGKVYLLAAVLAKFLLTASSINSFIRLRFLDEQSRELGVWVHNGVRADV